MLAMVRHARNANIVLCDKDGAVVVCHPTRMVPLSNERTWMDRRRTFEQLSKTLGQPFDVARLDSE